MIDAELTRKIGKAIHRNAEALSHSSAGQSFCKGEAEGFILFLRQAPGHGLDISSISSLVVLVILLLTYQYGSPGISLLRQKLNGAHAMIRRLPFRQSSRTAVA